MAQIKISTFCCSLCGIFMVLMFIGISFAEDSREYRMFIEIEAYYMIACFLIVPVGLCLIQKHNREEQYRPLSPRPYIASAPPEPSHYQPIPSQQHPTESEIRFEPSKFPSDQFYKEQTLQNPPDQIFCQSCGSGNSPNAQYCFACGEHLK